MTENEKAFLAQVALGLFKVEMDGTIWRLAKWTGGGLVAGIVYTKRTRAERSTSGQNGYLRIMFKDGMIRRVVAAHRIIWMIANRRPIPERMEINHIDGKKSNNTPSNLELTTHQQNAQHSHTHLAPKKKDQRGEKNSAAAVTESQVIEIRTIWANRSLSQREIAAKYKITQSTVSAIVARKSWAHLP
ncbi:HNH endonuclease signature motif containing protein [Nitrobacter sp.]|uniref:HNH endonuclease signature motif containing protein n=1 Tax=Nitrobacter sp. TaxID=29420 RepID=UPI00341B3B50